MPTFDDNDYLVDLAPVPPKPKPSKKIVFQPDGTNWSLDRLPEVESAYQAAFKRKLPLANRGQGSIHNKWGYDHRNSADVSINPNTPEGQQFGEQLRKLNVPFLAFTGAIPGVATGPHYHLGLPSHKTTARYGVGAQAKKTQQAQSPYLVDVDEPQAPAAPAAPSADDYLVDLPATGMKQSIKQRQAAESAAQIAVHNAQLVSRPAPSTGMGDFRRTQAQLDRAATDTGAGRLRQLDQPETQRINRIQREITAEQSPAERNLGLRPGARLMDASPTENEEVLRRVQEEQLDEQHAVKMQAMEPEIKRLTDQYRQRIRASAGPGGASVAPTTKWSAEMLASGGGGLGEMFAAGLRAGVDPILHPAGALLGDKEKTDLLADTIQRHAIALQRAAEEEGADRSFASKLAQNAVAGFISTSPELAAIAVGLPPVAAFGLGGGARAYGRGERPKGIAKGAGHGMLSGLAYELPVPKAIKSRAGQTIAAGAETGLATAGLELASGAPPEQALGAGVTNALFRGHGEFIKSGVRERAVTIQRQLEAVQQGTRPAVLVPEGTPRPRIPEGLDAVRTSEGVFYYDPRQITRETLLSKVEDGTFHEVLGHVEPKSETTTDAVVARDAEGNEIQSSAVSPENVTKQADVMKQQYPEAQVETGGPEVAEKVLQERVGAGDRVTAPESPAPLEPSLQQPITANLGDQINLPRGEIEDFRPQTPQGVPEGYIVAPTDKGYRVSLESPEGQPINRWQAEYATREAAENAAREHAAETGQSATQIKTEREPLRAGMTDEEMAAAAYLDPSVTKRPPIEMPYEGPERRAAERTPQAEWLEMTPEERAALREPSGLPLQPTTEAGELTPQQREAFGEPAKVSDGTVREFEGKSYTHRDGKWYREDGRQVRGEVEKKLNAGEGPTVVTTPTVTEPVTKSAETPRAATPELQRHADAAAELRTQATAENLTSVERAALERKAARLDAKARGERLMRAGADPYELIDDIIIHGGKLLREGKAAYDAWSKDIRAKFGSDADPYLRDAYAQLVREGKPTSIKNAATEELRRDLGLAELDRPETKSWQTAIDNAVNKGLVEKAESIAGDIIAGNREVGLDYEQSAALNIKLRELENQWEAAYRADPKSPELADLKSRMDKLTMAVDFGGTEPARTLAFRRAMVDKDFKLINLVRSVEKERGRPVTDEELARFDKIIQERDAAVKELETATKERDAAIAKAEKTGKAVPSVEKFVREQKLKIRQQGRARTREVLRTERAEIKAQIAAAWAKTKAKTTTQSMMGLGDLDPKAIADITRLLTQLARNHIESGVVKAADLVDVLHNDVKDATDLTKREVSELFTGYGRVRERTPNLIDKKLNELKSIVAAGLGKADVLEKSMRAKRRGATPDKPTEDQRRALRELNDAMREHGPELGQTPRDVATEQATPLDKAKTTVRNRIEQLQQWIADGKREVGSRATIIPDAELNQLKAERAALEKVASLIDDPAANQRTIERRISELDKALREAKAKIQSGEVGPQVKEGAKSVWSPEIGERQKELETLRRVAADMRAAATKAAKEAATAAESATPFHGAEMSWSQFEAEAKRSLARVKQLEAQRAELERRVREGDFSERTKRTPPVYNDAVRRAENRVEAAETLYRKEQAKAQGGHQWRNASGVLKAWLLSGPPTQIKNTLGTGAWQAFEEQARVFGAAMDSAISAGRKAVGLKAQRGIMGVSPSAVVDSMLYAGRVGGKQAWDIITKGMTKEQMERHQIQEIDFGVNTGKKSIDQGVRMIELAHNAIFRFMGASDRIFYQGAHRRNLIDRANVIARNEGLRGKAQEARAKELIDAVDELQTKLEKGEKPNDLIVRLDADAKYDALVSTFNNDNALSTRIKRARGKVINPRSVLTEREAAQLNAAENFALDFILPFDRTPTNVISRIVEASPVGYLKNAGQVAMALKRGGMDAEAQRNFSRTFGRASAGTFNMALGAYLADKLIDIDDKGQVFLNLGFTKINLNTISPLGNIIALGAKMKKVWDNPDSTALDYAKPPLKELGNIPIVRATQPLTEAAQDPERSLPKTAARYASMGVPFSGALRAVNTATDTLRGKEPPKAKGFIQNVQKNIPILRERLPADVEGQARQRRASFTDRLRKGQTTEDEVDNAIINGELTKSMGERIKRDAGMTPRQVEFTNKQPASALDKYESMTSVQREHVHDIMARKAWALVNPDSDTTTESQRAANQARLDALGIEAVKPKKKSSSDPFKSSFSNPF